MRGLLVGFTVLLAVNAFYIDEWLTEHKNEKRDGHIWALIVAGSSGWGNYRHQSDICHLYHMLTQKHGIPKEYIVTMMYNDIAYNRENPYPGTIINALHGKDVYEGTMIDYMGDDVTAANFLSILKGERVPWGSGKVINSGSKDTVFVNFVDHGGPGVLGFPDDELHVADLSATLNLMHENRRYKQMLFYVEACYAGSMFSKLSPDVNITAHTASNAIESSYACVLDEELDVYLGDCWSLNWMNNTEQIFPNLDKETVEQQYEIVKEMTTKSHASIYGDVTYIYHEPISTFLGYGSTPPQDSSPVIQDIWKDALRSEDVMLDYLRRKRASAVDEELAGELDIQIKYHEIIEAKVPTILKMVGVDVTGAVEIAAALQESPASIEDMECNKEVLSTFFETCYKMQTHPYITKYLYSLTNLCNNYPSSKIIAAVRRNCDDN